MATKKQKRAAGLAKHEKFISDEKAHSQAILRAAREKELEILQSHDRPGVDKSRLIFLERVLKQKP